MNDPLIVNKLLWLDETVHNNENAKLCQGIKKILPDIILIPCDSLQKGFDELNKLKFELAFVIISGRLFENYILKLKNEFNSLKGIPLTMIYTSKKCKNELEGITTGNYAFSAITLASVKDPFLNPGGVIDLPVDIIKYIVNFNKTYYDEIYFKESKYKENLHDSVNLHSYFFEKIQNVNNLILPAIYSKLFITNDLIDKEIPTFIEFILNLNNNKLTKNVLFPLLKLKKLPLQIIIKFIFKAFINDENLFNILNKNLILSKDSNFSTFIKLMYKGLENFSLNCNFSNNLYKIYSINKDDLIDIEKNYNNFLQTNNSNIPFGFIFFKHFVDFDTNLNNLKQIKNENFSNEINVLFEILKFDKNNFYSFNIDSKDFNDNASNNKIYLFPYTPLVIHQISNFNLGNEKIKKITFKYLENYESEINKFNFDDNYFKNFIKFEYTKQVLYNPNLNEVNQSVGDFQKNITAIFKNNYNISKDFNIFFDQNKDAPPMPFA